MRETFFDIAVIGGGMAGSAAAANLALHSRVLMLERESQPGYHATGRSAALFSEIYGNAPIRALTRASRTFCHATTALHRCAAGVAARHALCRQRSAARRIE